MPSHHLTNFFFHYIITENFSETQLAHLIETNCMKYAKSISLLNKRKQSHKILRYKHKTVIT